MKAFSVSANDLSERFDSPSRVIPFVSKKKEKAFNLFLRVQGAMHHVPNFVETCKEILDAVMDEIDAENCSVMLRDAVSGELSVLASRGKNDKENGYSPDPSTEANRQKLKDGIAGWVLKEGQAVLINDAKEEPRFIRADGLNNNVRSLVCSPVRKGSGCRRV